MTASERAAFEKLYKTFNTQGQDRTGAKGEHEELDQIADEYYEDDEDNSATSLDKIFDAVLKPQPQKVPDVVPAATVTSQQDPPAEAPPETARSKRRKEFKAERERLKKLELEDRERIRTLIKDAQTDHELWQFLQREVFDPLRKLDLDNIQQGKSSSLRNKQGKNKLLSTAPLYTTDKRVLFANYPYFLLAALLTLRHQFPASPYALMLLPTIKSLGRSSYALGATTNLYKYLIRTAWLQQSSYLLVDKLLADMDANAIEFDAGILEVLDAILKEHELAQSTRLGKGVRMLSQIEQVVEDVEKIRAWRREIARRLGIETEAAQLMVPRRVDVVRDPGLRSARDDLVSNAAADVEQSAFDENSTPFDQGASVAIEETTPRNVDDSSVTEFATKEPGEDDTMRSDSEEKKKENTVKVVL